MTEAELGQLAQAAAAGLRGEDDAAAAKVYAAQVGVRLPGVG